MKTTMKTKMKTKIARPSKRVKDARQQLPDSILKFFPPVSTMDSNTPIPWVSSKEHDVEENCTVELFPAHEGIL